jgi:DNA-binding MarR family transcriptional regulator
MQVTPERERIEIDLGERSAALLMDGKRVAKFDVERERTLTSARVEELAPAEEGHRLVVFERSSPQARELLRRRGLSYAAADGELYVHAPPIHVERPARRRAVALTPAPAAPFAIRASRVPRWLLLHAGERPSFRELARTIELSEAMVSRTVRALADDGLVAIESDPDDARRRRVHLRDPGTLLDAFEQAIAARRPRRVTWDIGARDVPQAIKRLRMAAKRLQLPYAVSGLAGASFVRRVVEPATVDVWIGRDVPEQWAQELMAVPSRPGPGRITAYLAPDPFVLSLARRYQSVQVADPVQLYLDCRRAGERALEAADAIRTEMSW